MSPEQFLADFPPHIRAAAGALRSLVTRTVPGVVEKVYPGWRLIGYRRPAGKSTKYFAFVAPQDDRVLLGFEYGAFLEDPDGLLEGDGAQVRHVVIRRAGDIRKSEVVRLIEEASKLALVPKALLRRST